MKTLIQRKLLSLFLVLVIVVNLMPVLTLPANAQVLETQELNLSWKTDATNGFFEPNSSLGSSKIKYESDSIWIDSTAISNEWIEFVANPAEGLEAYDLTSVSLGKYLDPAISFEFTITGTKNSDGSQVSKDFVWAPGAELTKQFSGADFSDFTQINKFQITLHNVSSKIADIEFRGFTIANQTSSGNTPPIISDFSDVTFLENAVNADFLQIDSDVVVTDNESVDFDTGQVTISYSTTPLVEDQLSVGNIGNISLSGSVVNYSGVGQIGTLSGGANGTSLIISLNTNATPARTTELLEAITYKNTSDEPESHRTISITVSDGDGGTSIPVTAKISVSGQGDSGIEYPVLTQDLNSSWIDHLNNGFTIQENSSATFSSDVTSVWINNNGSLTSSFNIAAAEQFTGGMFDLSSMTFDVIGTGKTYTVTIIGYKPNGSTVTASVTGDSKAVLGTIDLTGIAGIVSFDFQVTAPIASNLENIGLDSFTIANPQSSGNINTPPVISGFSDVSFLENAINADFLQIDSDIVVTDNESVDFDTGQITISYNTTPLVEDQLSVGNIGNISLSGSVVNYSGVGQIGTLSGGANGTSLIISLNTNATPARTTELLEAITYKNTSDEPESHRTISITVSDGDGGTSIPVTAKISVSGQGESGIGYPVLTQDLNSSWIDHLNNGFTIQGNSGVTIGSDVTCVWINTNGSLTSSFNIAAAEQFTGGKFDLSSLTFDVLGTGITYTVTIIGYKSNGSTVTASVTGDSKAVLETIDLTGITGIVSFDFQVTAPAAGNLANIGLDSFTILNPGTTNAPPTDISLGSITIAENAASGTIIGTLTSVDADVGDTHTYSLVSGIGDPDNAHFSITGNNLKSNMVFDYETKSAYSIRIRTTDMKDANFEKAFVISVTDVYENPVVTTNSTLTLDEDATSTVISNAYLKTTVNAGHSAIYTMTTVPLKGTLKKGGTELNAGNTFTQSDIDTALITYTPNANTNGMDEFTFSVSDGTNILSGNTFTINIIPVNDVPVIASNTGVVVDEGEAVTITQTALEVTDNDGTVGALTYTISTAPINGTLYKSGVAIPAGGTFTQDDINNSKITYAHSGDEVFADSFEFTVSDGVGGTIGTRTFSITINPINDDPFIAGLPSDITVTENTPSHVDLSAATLTDTDSGPNSITLTLIVSSGTLSAISSGGVTTSGSGTATLTLTGTAANIDIYLNTASNIQYTGVEGSNGNNADTLTLIANDNGHTGIGGGDVSLGTVNIDITMIVPTVTNVTSTNNTGAYGIGKMIAITVEFSHAVTITGTPQLALETGVVDRTANYTSGSGSKSLTFTYTPQAGDESSNLSYKATNSLSLNGGTIKRGDISAVLTLPTPGTAGSLSTNKIIVIDTTTPTAEILVADTALKAGEMSPVTFTFSEAVTDFTNTDLVITNGSLSAVNSMDGGITWTATLTPAVDIEDNTNVITLDRTGVLDVAGNAGIGTKDSNNYAIDTKRPTATVVLSTTTLTPGQICTVTFTFSEVVTDFANDDITIDNGILTPVSSADGGVTYTATYTAASINDDTNTIVVNLTGITDTAGNSSTGTASSANYKIITLTVPGAPTIGTTIAGNGQVTVSFTPPASDGGAAITSYTVTANPGGITVTGNASPITVTGLTNSTAYTFTVTATNSVGTGSASMVSNSVTPQAPSSGGGGGNSTPKQTYQADVNIGDIGGSTLPIVVDRNTASASVDASSQSNLISEGKRAIITVPSIPNVDIYSVGIPIPDLSTANTDGSLTVDTEKGSIIVPSNMLTGIKGINGKQAQITIREGDRNNLPDKVKAVIGVRPLIQITMSIDGEPIEWSNPSAPVTVSMPYTPTAEELENPESIVVWYIDGNGNVVTIPNGRYDAVTGMVIFSTTHFSDYAVAFNKVVFSDVIHTSWYSDAVNFIAAREITTGMGEGKYNPNAKLTRGEFIVLTMRLYGVSPDANPTDNFSDAGNTYYTGYLATAKRLGITSGVGYNMFMPDDEITRQEMFTLLYNTLKVIDQLPMTHGQAVSEADDQPQGDSGNIFSDFTDAGQVNPWAIEAIEFLVKTGTISGSDKKLIPTGSTTRAEMAQVLYNLFSQE